MPHNGNGVKQDFKQAAAWFRKAAEQGWAALAQYNLGEKYPTGLAVEQDDEQAAAWFRKAADQGHAKHIWHSRHAANMTATMLRVPNGNIHQNAHQP
jgi:TPR repeat protein